MLSSDEIADLKTLYEHMYPNKKFETISMFVEASTRLVFGGEIYGSKLARSEKAKVIYLLSGL